MRLRNFLVFLFVVAPFTCLANEPASVLADMTIRSACVENLKGLGSASLIFNAPTKGDEDESRTASGEMSWEAQLVTESGQIVRVQLHCAGFKSLQQQDKRISGQSQGFVSELVRH